ncbi:sensor histidine kinase [Actinoallomurus soli]|uniref:sensor histidine kinase n=1 Tax=Actinoallomurus soli TaxID=2952535 RepID=UPI0020937171|nr:nitrate- and nitrite sensing domain-containing protein [Actinoallomurus soli]MCO5970482.1 nitrate- and nitrite sensing domain-containing protein [Actinoallomurus soli]
MRRRLIALILIPTVVAVAFGGLRIATSVSRAQTYNRVENLAELGSQITALVHALSSERDLTAAYIADNRNPTLLAQVQEQYPKADAAVVQVRRLAAKLNGSYGSQVLANATRMRNRLDAIPNLRDNAARTKMPAASVIIVYSESINDLLAFNDVIAQGAADETLTADVRALVAVSRAKEQASEQRALLYSAALNGALTVNDVSSLAAAEAREQSELASFREAATFQQSQMYDDTVIGPDVDESAVLLQRAIALGLGGKGTKHLDLDPDTTDDAGDWLKTSTAKIDLMRQVERKLADEVIAGSKHRQSDALRSAILNSAAIAIVLILVLIVTLVMAQSLVRPLRKLREGALEVAGHRLPDLVRRLRDAEAGNEPIAVEPIDVFTTDEIGEVARSFDEVHREAVRLASNEALLRGNVNAMFVNLSRRSQSLIERQLRLIEDLEQSEQDAARLESLFKLDHLATRMRRNGENLLVLGGQEQTRRWNKPVPLVDIVRASLSEVEQYERVTLRIQDDVSVIGRVVNDLVHLVAELVENSTTFSPEHTKVAVSGHLLSGGGAMLQISDNGVGMSPEELEEANWKLANPPTIDVSISRRMGLFVVGRLAQRHGIRVELRAALSGGLTAFVILPANAIQDGNPPAPRRLDSPVETAPRRSSAVEAPAVRGQLPRSAEPIAPAPVPDTPWEPARARTETGRTAFEPAPLDTEPPRGPLDPPQSPAEPLRRSAQPVWDEPEPAEPAWGRREPERRPAEPAEPAEPVYGQSEQPRGPQGSPLPKRKPANTSPPGRGAAPSAPGRSGTPGGGPPPARPSRPQNPPFPPARQPTRPSATGSMREEGRLGDQNGGRSPIFEAMQSEWFQRRKTGSMARSESTTSPSEWSSPADEGFRAAETVRAPSVGGKTAAGLPKRVPGNNRIPGSIASARPAPPPQQSMQQPVQPPVRPAFQPPEAETVRNRFSSFQQGVRRGRAAIRPEDDERENQ